MLSATGILDAIRDRRITIDPFTAANLQPNSYDVTLGETFYLVEWTTSGPLFYGPIHATSRVYIPVGGTLLGATVETIGSYGIVAQLHARSSTRRKGVTICDDAGFGDNGYHNRWTMELTGYTTRGVPFLEVGDRIAQVEFERLDGEAGEEYQGQYHDTNWPEAMVPAAYRDRIREPDRRIAHMILDGRQ